MEKGSGRRTELEVRDGMHFDGGYLSPHFAGDSTCMRVEMEEPFVLVHNGKIASFGAIEPALRAFAKSGKWLLVIAHDVVGEALATLVVNRRQANLKVAAVRAPGVGPFREAVLEDIAITTGAELVGNGLGHTLEKLRPEMLGRADARRGRRQDDNHHRGPGGHASHGEALPRAACGYRAATIPLL